LAHGVLNFDFRPIWKLGVIDCQVFKSELNWTLRKLDNLDYYSNNPSKYCELLTSTDTVYTIYIYYLICLNNEKNLYFTYILGDPKRIEKPFVLGTDRMFSSAELQKFGLVRLLHFYFRVPMRIIHHHHCTTPLSSIDKNNPCKSANVQKCSLKNLEMFILVK